MIVPEELIEFLLSEKEFLLATHINPEGDALGSALALSMALESLGKETVVYDRDHVPESYRFLPGYERFTNSLPSQGVGAPLILLDCNEPERAGFDNIAVSFAAVIDHHETEKDFGNIRWIEPHAAATGLMVFHLIRSLGVPITKDMAANLYTALAIDTGTFRYSNVTSDTLRVAAELVDAGADPAAVAVGLYETWSGGRFRLLIEVLNTLEIVDKTAMIVARKEAFTKTGTAGEDTENFGNFPRMMRDIEVAAFFRETEDGWKVSLRSKGSFNVARIAARFNGGGHRNAAGYRTRGDLGRARKALIDAVADRE
ncbi:MAG TPA: bifunctional oligoribonuclease/PAP phosphatase NrnA [Thermodesulfovibrionales bacterium]|nr:bifunctional oligoribonuclease/PAP phosphatase NrnA [Thermodesulfovibrionales bacterium]